jgi:uncharacterized coiled-coil protein SlyX
VNVDGQAVIRAAMENLIAGSPVRSDGKLTISNLAKEARLHRQRLYADHADLIAEFKTRTGAIVPAAFRQRLQTAERAIIQLKAHNAELTNRIADQEQQIAALSALIVELTHEQHQPNITPLRPLRNP